MTYAPTPSGCAAAEGCPGAPPPVVRPRATASIALYLWHTRAGGFSHARQKALGVMTGAKCD